MVQEVVNSIIEAEDKAKQMVQDAQSKANEIVANAQTQADDIKHNAVKSNKEYLKTKLTDAQQKADSKALEQYSADCQQIDEEVKAYGKNFDNAVKLVLENIL